MNDPNTTETTVPPAPDLETRTSEPEPPNSELGTPNSEPEPRPPSLEPRTSDGPPSSLIPHPSPFPRLPSETPRAFDAFIAFFQLGHGRSLQAVANQLGESLDTVKRWSSKHLWSARLQSFQSGLLQQQAEAEAAVRRQQAEHWARRTGAFRELEWAAAQKLLAAAECFLETVGDREVEKMSLGQASRALEIASRLARLALSGNAGPEEPALAPIQLELVAALKKAYGQPPPEVDDRASAADPGLCGPAVKMSV